MRTWWAAVVILVALAGPAGASLDVAAGTPPLSGTRINATGHPLRVMAGVSDGMAVLGEVSVEIGNDDSVRVDRSGLLDVLKPHVAEGVRKEIASAAPGLDMVPVGMLANVGGASISFNPGDMGLVLKKSADTSATTDIPMLRKPVVTANRAPAALSAFVNLTTSVDAIWDTPSGPPVNMNLEFDGAVRAFGFVLEGDGRLDGPLDNLICPAQAMCLYRHESGFKRQATRLVKEFDGLDDVLVLGDISYSGYAVQRGGDVLGIGLSHDTRRFGEDDRLNATGSLLVLDSPAEVEVLVNGSPLEHLHLNTGTYRLTDLPLLTGANTVQLLVTEADGRSRKIVLTALGSDGMLKPGASEWSVNAGVASYVRDAERTYLTDRYVANGYFRYGFSSELTGDVHAQADSDVAMAGLDASMLSPLGLITVGAAASAPLSTPEVSGYAVTLAWQYVRPARDGRDTASVSARYASGGFRTPGDRLVGANGVLYPSFDPAFLVSGSWSHVFQNQWMLSGSGRYALANADSVVPGALDTGARWGADIALTVPVVPSLQASLWGSYGNEHLLTFLTAADTRTDATVGLRLAWQPDERTSVYASGDSGLHSSSLYATTRTGSAHDGWEGTLSAIDTEGLDSTVSAAVSHHGPFGDTTLVQQAGFEHGATDRQTYERTSMRSSSGFVFADGHFGMGPPVRDSFALVYPHASIADSDITVGDARQPVAKGDGMLAAVVTDLPSHQATALPLDAGNLPVGYSLGDAMLNISPAYKSGYAVELGSDHAMSVFGVLLDETGEPLALASGGAVCGGRKVDVFTNRAGRFGLEGISSGRCRLELAGDRGRLTYDLPVPDGAGALVKVGSLHPNEKGEPAHGPWTTVTLPSGIGFSTASR